jgi:hypothetical protein
MKNLKGGYCLAKLVGGEYMVDVMTAGEIEEVRNSSKAKKGPWAGAWAGEMAKKTLVKRAYKSWPQSGGRERLDEAVSIVNQHEGVETVEAKGVSDYLQHSPEQKAEMMERLDADPMDFFLWWRGLDDRIKISLNGSFEKGEKGKGQRLINDIDNTGRNQFDEMVSAATEACTEGDEVSAAEILAELTESQKNAVLAELSTEHYLFIREVLKAA